MLQACIIPVSRPRSWVGVWASGERIELYMKEWWRHDARGGLLRLSATGSLPPADYWREGWTDAQQALEAMQRPCELWRGEEIMQLCGCGCWDCNRVSTVEEIFSFADRC